MFAGGRGRRLRRRKLRADGDGSSSRRRWTSSPGTGRSGCRPAAVGAARRPRHGEWNARSRVHGHVCRDRRERDRDADDATTDAAGQAKTRSRSALRPGQVTITATVAGTQSHGHVRRRRPARRRSPRPVRLASPTTPAAGEVRAGCRPGPASVSAAARRARSTPSSRSTRTPIDYGDQRQSVFTAQGAAATVVGRVGAQRRRSTRRRLADWSRASTTCRRRSTRRLREIARRELTPEDSRRAGVVSRGRASFASIPGESGRRIARHAERQRRSDIAPTQSTITSRASPRSRTTAIVVADTANPAGGFTDAEYQSFATTFDTLIGPLDVANFGQPTRHRQERKDRHLLHEGSEQADAARQRGRRRRILLRARSVPHGGHAAACSAAPASNFAEMYLRARAGSRPDDYSDARSKQNVLDLTPGTLAHEYQHLINAGRRIYVNNRRRLRGRLAQRRTEPHRRGAAVLPASAASGAAAEHRRRDDSVESQASIDAFNKYQGDNIGRFEIFLGKPSQTSVYARQRFAGDARRDVAHAPLSRRPSRHVGRRHVDRSS